MSRALSSSDCTSILLQLRSLYLTPMLIGVAVLTPVVLRRATVCFWVTTSFPGHPRDNPHFLAPVPRLSTVALPMWFLNHVGCVIFSWSFISLFLWLLWCTATMSVLFTFQAIRSIISAPNTLRWTSILFGRRSLEVRLASFMFLPAIRLPTSSPKVYLEFSSMILGPVSAFVHLQLQLRGCDRIRYNPCYPHALTTHSTHLCSPLNSLSQYTCNIYTILMFNDNQGKYISTLLT